MSKKRFRCGLLVESSRGDIRQIKLSDGGGGRTLDFDHIDMDFDTIRDRLISLYEFEPTDDDSYSLYDFQKKPLNLQRYSNFLEYQQQNGLMFNSILLYLCKRNSARAATNNNVSRKVTIPTKAKTTLKRVQSNDMTDEDVQFIEERPPKRKIMRPAIADVHISVPTSSSSVYYYERHNSNFVEHSRFAMNQERPSYASTQGTTRTESRYSTVPQITKGCCEEEETFDDQIRYFSRRSFLALNNLLNISHREGSMFLWDAAQSALGEIEKSLCNLQSSDSTSLIETQQCIETVRRRLARIFNKPHRFALSEQEKQIFGQVNRVLQTFAYKIHRQASQINVEHRLERLSRWSSPPRQYVKKQSSIKLPKQRTSNVGIRFDDDSSVVSGSSMDDDALLQTATKAIERFSKKKI